MSTQSPQSKKSGAALQVASLILLLTVGAFYLGSLLTAQAPVDANTKLLSYNDFENEVREQVYEDAVVDGNVIVLRYKDTTRKSARVEAPEVSRAVGLLVKFEVRVRARRALPANGLTTPVLIALTLPYLILGFYSIGLVKAATSDADIDALLVRVDRAAGKVTGPAPQPDDDDDDDDGQTSG